MAATYITMFTVLGIVWGGLILVLIYAFKKEESCEVHNYIL